MERVLAAFVYHSQQVEYRLDQLERRADAVLEATLDGPTHDDVLEVRVHSARVAAELARVAVELRAEIDKALVASSPSSRQQRINTVAETIIDLSDRLDTLPGDRRAS